MDIKDKIVIIPTRKHPNKPYSSNYLTNYTYNEYEYVLDGDTLPKSFEFTIPIGKWKIYSQLLLN